VRDALQLDLHELDAHALPGQLVQAQVAQLLPQPANPNIEQVFHAFLTEQRARLKPATLAPEPSQQLPSHGGSRTHHIGACPSCEMILQLGTIRHAVAVPEVARFIAEFRPRAVKVR
jgi:hypothetical protein